MVAVDVFDLDTIGRLNPVNAEWFLPFLIHRLKPDSHSQAATVEITLRDISGHRQPSYFLELHWGDQNNALGVPPVQESVVTEWAACGMACVIVPLYTQLRILQVTQAGDGFDFWVGDDNSEFGLEVSGTFVGDLTLRHRNKVQQLLASRHQVAGFVAVTRFRPLRSILSFHGKR